MENTQEVPTEIYRLTREDHLAWAKKRAMEYLDKGDYVNGISSMISDMKKHPELSDHCGLMMVLALRGVEDAKHWVEGFR